MNKKLKEVALHEKDTGSSEAQIALLTDKIENLSAHMKKFKKDKHSSVGLLKAVNKAICASDDPVSFSCKATSFNFLFILFLFICLFDQILNLFSIIERLIFNK